MPQRLEISTRTFLEVLAITAAIVLAYLIRDILFLLFISVILTSAGNPLIDRLEKAKIPRWMGVLFLYITVILSLTVVFALITPPLIAQTNDFLLRLPAFVNKAAIRINLENYIDVIDLHLLVQTLLKDFSKDLAQTPIHLVRFGAGVMGRIFTISSISVFTFYLFIEHHKLKELITAFFPKEKNKKIKDLIDSIENKLGFWLRGQIFLSLLIGFVTWLGLTLLQVNFALPLAILAGILEIIPMLGPFIAFVPAFIIALAFSPIKATSVILLYIFIQQMENSFIVPRVMKQAVGLDPLAVILALMIGSRLAGPLGAILAVPVTVVLLILTTDFLKEKL